MMRILALVALFAVTGCTSDSPSTSGVELQLTDLASARKMWRLRAPTQSYSFDFRRDCFCPHYGRTWHVEIRNGIVADYSVVDDQKPPPDLERLADLIPTIAELHDDILGLIERNLTRESTLRVEYDEELGYPSLIEWNAYPGGDDYVTLRVSNVVVEW